MHLSLSILFLRALSGGGKRRAIDSNACSGGEGAVAASWPGRTMVHPHTAASFAFFCGRTDKADKYNSNNGRRSRRTLSFAPITCGVGRRAGPTGLLLRRQVMVRSRSSA